MDNSTALVLVYPLWRLLSFPKYVVSHCSDIFPARYLYFRQKKYIPQEDNVRPLRRKNERSVAAVSCLSAIRRPSGECWKAFAKKAIGYCQSLSWMIVF